MTRRDFSCAISAIAIVLSGFGIAPARAETRIVILGDSTADYDDLRNEFPGLDLVAVNGTSLLDRVGDADALIGSCSREAIRKGSKLRWVQTYSAGVEGCMNPELVERPITLTNAKIVQGPEISDHAFALLLSLTRGIKQAVINQQSQNWGRDQYSPVELNGKTALVIGLGGIGTQVTQRARAFGMRVLGIDPKDIPFQVAVERVGKPDQLNEFLPEADVVFMCSPHTPVSEKMMGSEQFALMKAGAYFINVSRGKTVDTSALVNTLRSGHLAGVGIDVVDPEPLPPDHPLWGFENVVITPHIAGQSDQIGGRITELIRENIRRFVKSQPMRNVVDKSKGY